MTENEFPTNALPADRYLLKSKEGKTTKDILWEIYKLWLIYNKPYDWEYVGWLRGWLGDNDDRRET